MCDAVWRVLHVVFRAVFVWCVVCGVRCAVFSVRCEVMVWCMVCGVRCVKCVWGVMWYVVCAVRGLVRDV